MDDSAGQSGTKDGQSGTKDGQGGSIPGADGHAAFTLSGAQPSAIPVLIAVPHAGRVYPESVLAALRHPGAATLRLEDRLVDLVGAEIARETGAMLLVAHAPRAMIDLNRGVADIDPGMLTGTAARDEAPAADSAAPSARARSGLGLVPRRVPGLGELWNRRLDRADLARRVAAIHQPYHARLAQALADLRDRWGAALLIDLHSMPPLPVTAGTLPAELVLGDRFGASCDGRLVAAAFASLGRCGRRTAHNRPYAGGHVLDSHAAPRRGLHALQLEIDRALYLDPALREPGAGLAPLVRQLSVMVRDLAGEVAALGAPDAAAHWANAAE